MILLLRTAPGDSHILSPPHNSLSICCTTTSFTFIRQICSVNLCNFSHRMQAFLDVERQIVDSLTFGVAKLLAPKQRADRRRVGLADAAIGDSGSCTCLFHQYHTHDRQALNTATRNTVSISYLAPSGIICNRVLIQVLLHGVQATWVIARLVRPSFYCVDIQHWPYQLLRHHTPCSTVISMVYAFFSAPAPQSNSLGG